MFRSIEKDHNHFIPFLEKGEILLATCQFRPMSALKYLTIGGGLLSNSFHLVGVTNKRIITMPLSNLTGKPVIKKMFSVPVSCGHIEGGSLLVEDPATGKTINFRTGFGFNKASGSEAEKFLEIFKKT
jgi:hypothetical protein